MVNIRKEKRGKKIYFYLEHSLRTKDKVKKKRLYLGEGLPQNVEILKKKFLHDIYKEKWYPLLDSIKKDYVKDHKDMPKSIKEKELANFIIKFTYDTQRIEGSTLTLRETADLLEKGITPNEKPIGDVKEAEAHKKVFYEMLRYEKDLSLQLVLSWNKKLLQETKPDIAGKVRKHQVAIGGSKFLPPSPVEMDVLLDEFFKWYCKNKDKFHPVELAALVHLKFVTIHPFGDGNGRISRLMMNFVLHKQKFPLFSVPYKGRSSYYTALERSQVKGEEHIFVQWFIKRYVKEKVKK
ncbi:MAG: Fic family protein [Candidatus Woesearchaeota archaeon]